MSAAESNAELADSVAGDWLWYGGVRTPEELEARLRRVGRRDVIAAVDAFVEGAVITVSAWGRDTRPGEVE